MTLGDGAGNSLYANKRIASYVRSTDNLSVRIKNFVNDPMTGKSYALFDECKTYTSILLNMISSRYDVAIVGFYLCDNRMKSVFNAIRDNTEVVAGDHVIENARVKMRKEGFYSLPNPAYKELFLINDTSTNISTDHTLDVDSTQSAASIARAMTKNMVKQIQSRVVLDRFIGYVA